MAHAAVTSGRNPLLVVVVAAAALTAAFTLGCGSHADKYVGYWSVTGQASPTDQSFALHISRSGDHYLVDAGGSELTEKAQLSDGKLEVPGPGQKFELTLKGDQLQLTSSGTLEPGGSGTQHLIFRRIDAAQFAAAREYWKNRANDAAVRAGIHSIQIGIQTWAVDHNDRFPKADLVSQDGLAADVDTWPTNPFTNQPMHAGTGPGDYRYTSNGKTYKLTGFGSDGKPVIFVP